MILQSFKGVRMRSRVTQALIVLLIVGMLSFSSLASNNGPPGTNDQGDSTVEYGCTCHNSGSPSNQAVVMITGIPVMYEMGSSYDFTITVADSLTLSGGDGNTKAGFLFSSNSVGQFSWSDDEDIRNADGNPDDISHSDADADGIWVVTWSAPSSDVGSVHFYLAGNSVDSSGAADAGDYWNLLSFSITAPGTISEDESGAVLSTRTISVGDYDSLFVIEESASEIEAARQKAISERVFSQGNLFYWFSLALLIVGAVVQREIFDRKYGEKPEYLSSELAYPQGLRRGLVAILSFYFGVKWLSEGNVSDFSVGMTLFVSGWAFYGVYRTVLSTTIDITCQKRF
ncbi:MAG: hypothetical protein CXT72_07395 [Methanobacteriota archaeon]|nr:MAG: hypothetical protein CXT72_07395 [Euryarchaeota archaeon]